MATENSSLNNLMTVYKWVVEDVVKNVKDEFLNDGVDPQVLDELKQLWLNKIDHTRHISRPPKQSMEPTPPHPPPTQSSPRKEGPPPLLPVNLVEVQSTVHPESVIHRAPPRIPAQLPPQLLPQSQPPPASSTPTQSPSSTPTTRTAFLVPAPGYAGIMPPGAVAVSNSISQLAAMRPSPTVTQFMSPPAIVVPSQAAAIAGLQQTSQMMVPVQTSQGTVIMPLSQILAIQAQQRALAVAKAASQQSAATSQGSSANVDQTDGLPPLLSESRPSPVNQQSAAGTSASVTQTDVLPTLLSDDRLSPASSSKGTEILDSETQLAAPGTMLRLVKTASGEDLTVAAANETGFLCGSCSRTVDDSSTPVTPTESCQQQDSALGTAMPFPNRLELSCKQKGRWRGGTIVQLDGASGGGGGGGGVKRESSSEEESDDNDDTSEEDELEPADENPLCSDDDVDDASEESGEDFETADTMVCQFEKVYRVKTKWKFQLKDGIMQIGGHDYVFHKAMGEADW